MGTDLAKTGKSNSAPNGHAAEGEQSVGTQNENTEGRGARRVFHPRSVKRQDPKSEPNKQPTEREPKRHQNTINRRHLRNCNRH